MRHSVSVTRRIEVRGSACARQRDERRRARLSTPTHPRVDRRTLTRRRRSTSTAQVQNAYEGPTTAELLRLAEKLGNFQDAEEQRAAEEKARAESDVDAQRRGWRARSPAPPPSLPSLLVRDGACLAAQARRSERKRLRRELKEQQRVAADAVRSSRDSSDDADDGETVSAERRESADSTPLLAASRSLSGSATRRDSRSSTCVSDLASGVADALDAAAIEQDALGDVIAVEHIE